MHSHFWHLVASASESPTSPPPPGPPVIELPPSPDDPTDPGDPVTPTPIPTPTPSPITVSDISMIAMSVSDYNTRKPQMFTGDFKTWNDRLETYLALPPSGWYRDPTSIKAVPQSWNYETNPALSGSVGQYHIVRRMGDTILPMGLALRATKNLKCLDYMVKLLDHAMDTMDERGSVYDGNINRRSDGYLNHIIGTKSSNEVKNDQVGAPLRLECAAMMSNWAQGMLGLHRNVGFASPAGFNYRTKLNRVLDIYKNHLVKAWQDYRDNDDPRQGTDIRCPLYHAYVGEMAAKVVYAIIDGGANYKKHPFWTQAKRMMDNYYTLGSLSTGRLDGTKNVFLTNAANYAQPDVNGQNLDEKYPLAILWSSELRTISGTGKGTPAKFYHPSIYQNEVYGDEILLYLEGFYTDYFGSQAAADTFMQRKVATANVGVFSERTRAKKRLSASIVDTEDTTEGRDGSVKAFKEFPDWSLGNESIQPGTDMICGRGYGMLGAFDKYGRIGEICQVMYNSQGSGGKRVSIGHIASMCLEHAYKDGRGVLAVEAELFQLLLWLGRGYTIMCFVFGAALLVRLQLWVLLPIFLLGTASYMSYTVLAALGATPTATPYRLLSVYGVAICLHVLLLVLNLFSKNEPLGRLRPFDGG